MYYRNFPSPNGPFTLAGRKIAGAKFPLDYSGWVRWNADSKRTTNGDDEKTGRIERALDFVRRILCERTSSGYCYLAESPRQSQCPLPELPYSAGLEAHSCRSGIR